MDLRQDFYTEIFENEQKWIDLINSKLLNSIYCKYTLQPFYLKKKQTVKQEYFLTKNEYDKFIDIIDSIIEQIEVFNQQFKSGQKVDISTLKPLFLITQIGKVQKAEEDKSEIRQEINELQIRKQLLENQIRNFDKAIVNEDDYIYDDFPEEIRKVK